MRMLGVRIYEKVFFEVGAPKYATKDAKRLKGAKKHREKEQWQREIKTLLSFVETF